MRHLRIYQWGPEHNAKTGANASHKATIPNKRVSGRCEHPGPQSVVQSKEMLHLQVARVDSTAVTGLPQSTIGQCTGSPGAPGRPLPAPPAGCRSARGRRPPALCWCAGSGGSPAPGTWRRPPSLCSGWIGSLAMARWRDGGWMRGQLCNDVARTADGDDAIVALTNGIREQELQLSNLAIGFVSTVGTSGCGMRAPRCAYLVAAELHTTQVVALNVYVGGVGQAWQVPSVHGRGKEAQDVSVRGHLPRVSSGKALQGCEASRCVPLESPLRTRPGDDTRLNSRIALACALRRNVSIVARTRRGRVNSSVRRAPRHARFFSMHCMSFVRESCDDSQVWHRCARQRCSVRQFVQGRGRRLPSREPQHII
jgi:hypothetical protein